MGELNLIPYHIKQKKSRNVKLMKYSLLSIIIIAVLFGGLVVPYVLLSGINYKNEELQRTIDSKKSVLAESDKLKQETSSLKVYMDSVDIIKNKKIIVSERIKNIENYAPKDIIVKSLSYNSNIITITGTTKNYASISEFGANLQMSKEYTQAIIGNIKVEPKTSECAFTITTVSVGGEKK